LRTARRLIVLPLKIEQVFPEPATFLALALIAAPAILALVLPALAAAGEGAARQPRYARGFYRVPRDQAKRPDIADNSRFRLRYDL